MGEGGMGYLEKADGNGRLDTWELILGYLAIVHLCYPGGMGNLRKPHMSWVIIVGIFALCSFIIMIIKLSGCCQIPMMAIMVFYIIAAIVIFLTACICFSMRGCGYEEDKIALFMCLSMAIFYAYSAYNTHNEGFLET